MKALSVRQPWASLIAAGTKMIEVRSRRTSHRGPLLICASRFGDPADGRPRGVSLCIVDVIDCRPLRPDEDRSAACFLGTDRQWAWVLANPRQVDQVPVRGQLGLFEVETQTMPLVARDCS